MVETAWKICGVHGYKFLGFGMRAKMQHIIIMCTKVAVKPTQLMYLSDTNATPLVYKNKK